jgi:hypothetical protein
MIIALKLLSWLLVIGGNVYLDRKGRKPHYLIMFLARGFCAIVHGSLLFTPNNWKDYAPVFVFQITSFWLFFELALNIVRKNPLLYYDKKENDSGWIDGFFYWLYRKLESDFLHTYAKALAFVLMVISIIVIYYRA